MVVQACALSSIATSSFSFRTTDLVDWHVDADRGAIPAGVRNDGIVALSWEPVGFASQIPVFLMAPIGGMVADRVNRHRDGHRHPGGVDDLWRFILAIADPDPHRSRCWHILRTGRAAGGGERVRYSRDDSRFWSTW